MCVGFALLPKHQIRLQTGRFDPTGGLLQALADRRDEAILWWGACDALQTPHPLAPLHDIARSSNVGFRALMSADTDRADLFEAVLSEMQRSRRPILGRP